MCASYILVCVPATFWYVHQLHSGMCTSYILVCVPATFWYVCQLHFGMCASYILVCVPAKFVPLVKRKHYVCILYILLSLHFEINYMLPKYWNIGTLTMRGCKIERNIMVQRVSGWKNDDVTSVLGTLCSTSFIRSVWVLTTFECIPLNGKWGYYHGIRSWHIGCIEILAPLFWYET